jgi:hypothetical protein
MAKTKTKLSKGGGDGDGETGNGSTSAPKLMRLDMPFNLMYTMIAYLCVAVFVMMTVLSAIDLIYFTFSESDQFIRVQSDSKVLNKDTNDMSLMQYASIDSVTDENDYHIYLNQGAFTTVIGLIAFAIVMICLEYGMMIAFPVFYALSGTKRTLDVNVVMAWKYIGILGIAGAGVATLNTLYTKLFVDKSLPIFEDTNNKMRDIKRITYHAMSMDQTFLTEVVNNSSEIQYQMIHAQLSRNTPEGDHEVARMICTLNIYNYFTSVFKQTDPNYDTVVKMFTLQNIETHKIDPSLYLHYNTSVYIKNLYDDIKQNMINTGLTFMPQNSEQRENRIKKQIHDSMTELNSHTNRFIFNGISNGKEKVGWYLSGFFWVSFIFTAIIMALMYQDMPEPIKKALNFLSPSSLLNGLNKLIRFIKCHLPFVKCPDVSIPIPA